MQVALCFIGQTAEAADATVGSDGLRVERGLVGINGLSKFQVKVLLNMFVLLSC